MKLYRKADGEIVGTQALAGKGYTQIEVPTDKPGLIAWLNEQAEEAFLERHDIITPRSVMTDVPFKPAESDVLTHERVEAMFASREDKPPLARDAVCASIAQYEGTDLGYVALEVAARYQGLANRDALLS